MTWWVKARQIVLVLGTGIGVVAFAVCMFTGADASLMSWTVGRQTLPVLTFAPLVLAATLAFCLDSRLPEAELTAIRPVPAMDTLLISSAVAATVIIAIAAFAVTHIDDALVLARNTLFLSGLMLIARSFIARGGVVVATGWVLVVILVGRRTPVEYFPWAVTGLPIATPHATIAAVFAITLGVLLTFLSARKLP